MINLTTLTQYLDELLEVSRFSDYAPNGLQVEGKSEINVIVSGVTASLQLIEYAIEQKADLVLVHHGYFWKGEAPELVGMKRRRIAGLIKYDMNLLGYHLPLDAHPELGNNAQLATLLGLTSTTTMDKQGVGNVGYIDTQMDLDSFAARIHKQLQREPLVISGGNHAVKKVAWCSGGAQKYLQKAAELGADTYISGEVSENTYHEAKELGIHYIAAGHHATERYGVQALGCHLADHFNLSHHYYELDNPV